jgi:orotate phosphoribosyltransferase
VSTTHALTELRYAVHVGDPHRVEEMLLTPQALLDGHFNLLSGLHTDRFLAFSRIADDPAALRRIAAWLAPSLEPLLPNALLAPSTAGVGLGWALARILGVPLHLAMPGCDGRATAILGSPDLVGERVLLINDVVTTGKGLLALSEVAAAAGAEIIGASWFASRGNVDVAGMISTPAIWVTTIDLLAWPQHDCPLCSACAPLQQGLDLN